MPKSKIPSPARSQGGISTPRRNKPRGSRSVCSPALSTASGRLTSVIDQFREKNLDSFALSPLNSRKSVLTDNTDIEEPRRKSWWKNLNENSRDVMEVLDDDKATASNEIENIVDIEVLSQEKKNYTLDLPESSDNESINSIVLPQRRLFTQKENQPQKKFGQLFGARDTLAKLHKTNTTHNDKTITAGTKDLFQGTKRSKPIFPAALLSISPNKTVADKTKESVAAEPKVPVRNIIGNRPTNKRKNIFADFIESESEDDISEIQAKVFGFQKKIEQHRFSSVSKGKDHSPTCSITTDMELDDWKHLPSSTMVENQLDEMVAGHTPVKRARLSKLSEAKESELGTITIVDKTKQSNQSLSSRSRSSPSSKATLNNSNTTVNKTAHSNKSVTSKNKSRTSPRGKDSTKTEVNSNKSAAKNKSKKEEAIIPEDDDDNNFTLEYENDEDIVDEKLENNAQHQFQTNKISDKSHNATIIEKNKSKIQSNSEMSPNINPVNESLNKGYNRSLNKSTVNTSRNKNATKTPKRLANEKTLNESNNISPVSSINKTAEKSLNKSKVNKSSQKTQTKATKTIEESQESEQYSAQDNVDGELQNGEAEISHNKGIVEHEEQGIEVEVQKSHESGAERNIAAEEANKSQRNNSNIKQRVAEEEKEFQGEKSNVSEDKNALNISQKEEDAVSHELIKLQEEQTEEQENQAEESLEVDVEENQKEAAELNQEVAEQSIVTEAEESEEENEQENVSQEKEESQEHDEDDESQEIDYEADESQEVEDQDEEVEDQDDEVEDQDGEVEDQDEEAEDQDEKVEERQETEANKSEENVSKEVDNEAIESHNEGVNQIQEDNEVDQSQEHEKDDQSQKEDEAREPADVKDNNRHDEVNEIQDDDNDEVDQSQEVEDEAEDYEDAIEENNDSVNEIQEMEHSSNASDAEDSQEIENEEDEPNDSQEIEDNNQSEEDEDQELEDSADADRAIATDETSDVDQEEMDVDDEQNEESNNIEPEVVHSEEVIEESPNVTHDTTGRNRKKKITSPEVVRHDNTNQLDSFTAKGRNTSIRKTKSMYNDLNIRPSLAPARDSLGLSAPDSSAEGSGWDSHRTTRKTLRQTFGKDFTLRKSLRALVMEKSAKQTENMETLHSETVKFPQANSTEYPEDSNRQDEVESDHEVSIRTRQTTLETYLQKIKQQNIEKKMKMEEAIRNSLKAPSSRDTLNLFKVPSKPPLRKQKSASNKPKKPIKSAILLGELPSEVIEDMKYKPPKRFQPANASWITKRLYKFLENKLEPKYDYKARVRAEKLVETIYHFAKELRRHDVASPDSVDVLKHELARLDVVKTHFEFYEFFHEFMPREVRVKVVPDIVNKIPLPRHGVFADILRGNTVQG